MTLLTDVNYGNTKVRGPGVEASTPVTYSSSGKRNRFRVQFVHVAMTYDDTTAVVSEGGKQVQSLICNDIQ